MKYDQGTDDNYRNFASILAASGHCIALFTSATQRLPTTLPSLVPDWCHSARFKVEMFTLSSQKWCVGVYNAVWKPEQPAEYLYTLGLTGTILGTVGDITAAEDSWDFTIINGGRGQAYTDKSKNSSSCPFEAGDHICAFQAHSITTGQELLVREFFLLRKTQPVTITTKDQQAYRLVWKCITFEHRAMSSHDVDEAIFLVESQADNGPNEHLLLI